MPAIQTHPAALHSQTHSVTFAVLVAAAFLYSGVVKADPSIEVRQHFLVGDELRLIVETSRSYTPAFSHSSKTANAKGFLVTVNLASKKPTTDRARVIGPLWDVQGERSLLSFQVGAHFSEKDVAAAMETPHCTFDDKGTLLRFKRDKARGVRTREALLMGEPVQWQRQPDAKFVDDHLRPMSEDRLFSASGRHLLLHENGITKMHDMFTGEELNDAWLTSAFTRCHAIAHFQNVEYYLTEDLRHLVASPRDRWNDGFGSGRVYDSFDFNGQVFKRRDVGLSFTRPDPNPFLFNRAPPDEQGFLQQEPNNAFSIKGQLYLLAKKEQTLRLYTPDGKSEIKLARTSAAPWPEPGFLKMQHNDAGNEIVFFSIDLKSYTPNRWSQIEWVTRWNYLTNTITKVPVDVDSLFQKVLLGLQPRTLIQIK